MRVACDVLTTGANEWACWTAVGKPSQWWVHQEIKCDSVYSWSDAPYPGIRRLFVRPRMITRDIYMHEGDFPFEKTWRRIDMLNYQVTFVLLPIPFSHLRLMSELVIKIKRFFSMTSQKRWREFVFSLQLIKINLILSETLWGSYKLLYNVIWFMFLFEYFYCSCRKILTLNTQHIAIFYAECTWEEISWQ